jgi:hypothetical protein
MTPEQGIAVTRFCHSLDAEPLQTVVDFFHYREKARTKLLRQVQAQRKRR